MEQTFIHVDATAANNSLAGLGAEVRTDIQARPVDPMSRDSPVQGRMFQLDLPEGLRLLQVAIEERSRYCSPFWWLLGD